MYDPTPLWNLTTVFQILTSVNIQPKFWFIIVNFLQWQLFCNRLKQDILYILV